MGGGCCRRCSRALRGRGPGFAPSGGMALKHRQPRIGKSHASPRAAGRVTAAQDAKFEALLELEHRTNRKTTGRRPTNGRAPGLLCHPPAAREPGKPTTNKQNRPTGSITSSRHSQTGRRAPPGACTASAGGRAGMGWNSRGEQSSMTPCRQARGRVLAQGQAACQGACACTLRLQRGARPAPAAAARSQGATEGSRRGGQGARAPPAAAARPLAGPRPARRAHAPGHASWPASPARKAVSSTHERAVAQPAATAPPRTRVPGAVCCRPAC